MSNQIIELIPQIREEVGAIAKGERATAGASYTYRGHDTIVNAIAPILTKYGVFTTVEDELLEYIITPTGSKFWTTVVLRKKVTFHAPDGSSVTSTVLGESKDMSNKATNQAHTYAYRTALVQTFTFPTDEEDPDATYKEPTLDDASAPAAKSTGKPTVASLKNEIQRLYADAGVLSTDIQAEGDKFFEGKGGWATNVDALTKLRDHLKAEAEKK